MCLYCVFCGVFFIDFSWSFNCGPTSEGEEEAWSGRSEEEVHLEEALMRNNHPVTAVMLCGHLMAAPVHNTADLHQHVDQMPIKTTLMHLLHSLLYFTSS